MRDRYGGEIAARIEPFMPHRRHTLFFLRHARSASPVHLEMLVDMTRICAHRERARRLGRRYSFVSYVLYAAARAIARHPHANAAISERPFPFAARIARFGSVDAKLAFDKTLAGGRRFVASITLPQLERASLDDIQRLVDRYRDMPTAEIAELRGVLALHRVPAWLGGWLFRLMLARLSLRARWMGSFAVSSLGHRPVDGFFAYGGTPITLNLGQVKQRAVVKGGVVEAVHTQPVGLCFDHRVIDGADAADLLADLKHALEAACGFEADVAAGEDYCEKLHQ